MRVIIFISLCTICIFVATEALMTCGYGHLKGTECKRITDCKEVNDRIKQLHSTDPAQHHNHLMKYTQQITCGYERNVPKICCPVKNSERHRVISSNTCGNVLWNRSIGRDGDPAELNDFSWLALLEYNTPAGKTIGCGGVLISNQYVLTSAHCISKPSLVSVRLGAHDVNTVNNCASDGGERYCDGESITVGVERQIPHNNYKALRGPFDFEPRLHDIALLRLNRKVISNNVKPICISMNDGIVRNDKYLVAGWGANLEQLDVKSNVKRVTRMRKVDKRSCDQNYGKTLPEDVICASEKATSSCIGDVGGPLMTVDSHFKISVAGIYSPSTSDVCLTSGLPGTYTDVSIYRDWINVHMRE